MVCCDPLLKLISSSTVKSPNISFTCACSGRRLNSVRLMQNWQCPLHLVSICPYAYSTTVVGLRSYCLALSSIFCHCCCPTVPLSLANHDKLTPAGFTIIGSLASKSYACSLPAQYCSASAKSLLSRTAPYCCM